jgi:hypothetical protein
MWGPTCEWLRAHVATFYFLQDFKFFVIQLSNFQCSYCSNTTCVSHESQLRKNMFLLLRLLQVCECVALIADYLAVRLDH